jgi:hypothetical protein
MNGCVGGDGTIRPIPTCGRSAAAGRVRKRKSRMNSARTAIASRCGPESRLRMARKPTSGRHAMRWCSKLWRWYWPSTCPYRVAAPTSGQRRCQVCRARGPRSSPGQSLRAEDGREILLCLNRTPDPAGPVHGSHHGSAGADPIGAISAANIGARRSFWNYEKGISLGCPLSPLIGAFFLNALDATAAKLRLFYIRFMNDILRRWLRWVKGGMAKGGLVRCWLNGC